MTNIEDTARRYEARYITRCTIYCCSSMVLHAFCWSGGWILFCFFNVYFEVYEEKLEGSCDGVVRRIFFGYLVPIVHSIYAVVVAYWLWCTQRVGKACTALFRAPSLRISFWYMVIYCVHVSVGARMRTSTPAASVGEELSFWLSYTRPWPRSQANRLKVVSRLQ